MAACGRAIVMAERLGGSGRLSQRVRAVGLLSLALAAAAAAVLVISSPQAPVVELSDPQTCPPPCVPHVFSASEEALLAGGVDKGKLLLPGGDSAVEEAMKAASDANGQMSALSAGMSSQLINQGVSNPFRPTRQATAVMGHGGKPFVSQWDLMHGESDGDYHTHAASPKSATGGTSPESGSTSSKLQPSVGMLDDKDDESPAESSDDEARDNTSEASIDDSQTDERLTSREGDIAGVTSLREALRSLSNSRLRAIVRLLLKSRAESGGKRVGPGGQVAELRSILDGSRQQLEEKRRLEHIELARVRKAMDELAYKAGRRRREREEEEDAIAALTKRLQGDADGGDDRDRDTRDMDTRDSLDDDIRDHDNGDSRALLDSYDDVGAHHSLLRPARTDSLLQLLDSHPDRRERGKRIMHTRKDMQRKVATRSVVEELARLAARPHR